MLFSQGGCCRFCGRRFSRAECGSGAPQMVPAGLGVAPEQWSYACVSLLSRRMKKVWSDHMWFWHAACMPWGVWAWILPIHALLCTVVLGSVCLVWFQKSVKSLLPSPTQQRPDARASPCSTTRVMLLTMYSALQGQPMQSERGRRRRRRRRPSLMSHFIKLMYEVYLARQASTHSGSAIRPSTPSAPRHATTASTGARMRRSLL